MTRSSHLTTRILIGMPVGILVGYLCHRFVDGAERAAAVADYFSIVTDLFLRLIRMIIAPLVFSTLVVGVAHMGTGSSVGRIGTRTILWFLAASLVSLMVGLIMVQVLRPGAGLALPATTASAATAVGTGDLALKTFVTHLVPRSIFEAMANNEILQIVVFSVFLGVALAAVGQKAAPLLRGIESLVAVMLKITDYVMRTAPLAVFAAVAAVVTTRGLEVLLTYGKFISSFYLAIIVLWLLLAAAAYGARRRRNR